jgi:hypothetical protein
MADWPGRNPRKNVSDLVVWKRHVLGTAENREDIRGRFPSFLMANQGEIDGIRRPPMPDYTGN